MLSAFVVLISEATGIAKGGPRFCEIKPEDNAKGMIKMAEAPRYGHVDELPEFCTLADVAQLFPISQATVYRMVERGQLPCLRMGRRIIISREHLKLWMEKSMGVICNGQEV